MIVREQDRCLINNQTADCNIAVTTITIYVSTCYPYTFNTNAFVQVCYCFFYLDIHVYCTSTPLRGSRVTRAVTYMWCGPISPHIHITELHTIQVYFWGWIADPQPSCACQRTFALLLAVTCHTRGHSHMRGVTVYKTRSYSHLVLV